MKRLVSLFLVIALAGSLAVSAALGDSMYIIPDSDTRKLTEEELWEWDYESLGYILNEIYARHGYDFGAGEKYENYFSTLPWYTPNESDDNNQACYGQLNSTEWYNEALIKRVREEMRNSSNDNRKGKSIWDHYSSGFDVIQGFEYVQLSVNQTFAVYSAPDDHSWRGANGKACVSTNGAIYSDGAERGWLLVMYETNNGGVRVGYINKSSVKGKANGKVYNEELAFGFLPARVTSTCPMTDDPAKKTSKIMTLPAGMQVTYLTSYFNRNAWAYIETHTPDGLRCRGFIPLDCLEQGMGDPDLVGMDYDNSLKPVADDDSLIDSDGGNSLHDDQDPGNMLNDEPSVINADGGL